MRLNGPDRREKFVAAQIGDLAAWRCRDPRAAGARGPARREQGEALGRRGTGLPPSSRWRQDQGFGARRVREHSRVVIRARGIKSALAGGTHDAVQHLLGVGPALEVRLPPHTLRMTTEGSDGPLGAPVGGVYRLLHRSTAGTRWPSTWAKRSASASGGRASSRRPSRATSRPRADDKPWLADFARVRVVPQSEAVLQDRLGFSSRPVTEDPSDSIWTS